jgi:hypothetical protein
MYIGKVIFINWTKGKEWKGPIGSTGCICSALVGPSDPGTLGARTLRNWISESGAAGLLT